MLIRNKFNGKELDNISGLNWYDFSARYYDDVLGRFGQIDPMAEKYPQISPYVFCNNNPLRYIDPTGESWRLTFNQDEDGNKTYTGYEWVAPENSYDKNGDLLPGLYEQAIFFSDNGTYQGNGADMGSSTATVYLADGTTTTFDADTHPSDAKQYATVPEGLYEAYVGTHNGHSALKVRDIGAKQQTIELGQPNPSDPKRTYAEWVDVHYAGKNNWTGMYKKDGKMHGVSEACLLIDVNRFDNEFMPIFNNYAQKNNKVSITLSRTLSDPTNQTTVQQPAFNFIMNGRFSDYFNVFGR